MPEKSVNILSDKIKNGMQKFDVNPIGCLLSSPIKPETSQVEV